MNTCDTCYWWSSFKDAPVGVCQWADAVKDETEAAGIGETGFAAEGRVLDEEEGLVCAWVYTGAKFGCVLHKALKAAGP